MSRRAYRATRVNAVNWQQLAQGKEGLGVTVGVDVGKKYLWSLCRWADGRFERPWRVQNPTEIPQLVHLLDQMRAGRDLAVAMESSGTYGDSLRQALADKGIPVQRVSGKAAHDYAEVFDGVPSQHDGKDAAVVAELAALGKGVQWEYQPRDLWQQELRYWVEWMVAQRQLLTIWQGRLEGLMGRHWPEATQILKLSSVTLLRALHRYGDPRNLAADQEAVKVLTNWGGPLLSRAKIGQLLASAGSTVGVRVGAWEGRQIQEYAQQALTARREALRAQSQLRRLAEGHPVLQAQGKAVGLPTACVLWTSVGDPRQYHSAGAYRKAMGLNLAERSSGAFKGQMHISKRGSARARQWVYFAALRLVQQSRIRPWYEAKKARNDTDGRRVVVAVMRKLVPALYWVGVRNEEFQPRRLFGRARRRRGEQSLPQGRKTIDGPVQAVPPQGSQEACDDLG